MRKPEKLKIVKSAVKACKGKGGPGGPALGPKMSPVNSGPQLNPNLTIPQNAGNTVRNMVAGINAPRPYTPMGAMAQQAYQGKNTGFTAPKMPNVQWDPNSSPITPLKMPTVKNAVGKPTKNQDSMENAKNP